MTPRKPWQTKEWRKRRDEFVKDKSCAWCGSKENLTVSHDRKDFDPNMERSRVLNRYFHDYFDNGQHLDEFNQLKEQARAGVNLYYSDSCPNCGSGSVYSRSDEYCRENKKPKFRCSRCKTEFEEPVKEVKWSSLAYLTRRFFSLFQQRHGEELARLYTEHMEKLRESYLRFEGVTILCRRCHYAYHKGLNLCPVCKVHYKKKNHEMCWECFKKTEKGKKVLKLREEEAEDEKPVLYTHPWCGKTFIIKKWLLEFEYDAQKVCIDICGDVNSCETAKSHPWY